MKRDRWHDYLHERHSPGLLRAWARSLTYFRFCRAYGGHSNDGDRLLVRLRVETESDLPAVMSALGLPIERLPPDDPRPVAGMAYTAAEFGGFRLPMPRFPHVRQPGAVRIAGAAAHVWADTGSLTLSVNDRRDVYSVTDAAVESARAIEDLLVPVGHHVIDPPQDDRNCVCPRYYPQLWTS
ncbi:hypothetical protein [Nonomuraea roseola]|uniref:Uncharacterized protein n=1 Tax=Nonomuraea roseola TaxID=46179 RepID=A0ABV5Q4G7_9ACTN